MLQKVMLGFLSVFFFAQAAFAAEGCTVNRVLGNVQVLRAGQTMPVNEKDILKKGGYA